MASTITITMISNADNKELIPKKIKYGVSSGPENGETIIERKHKKELAKKLADISTMSIDDVLSQLQND